MDQATSIMKINITPELKAALELRHSKVRDRRERDRIKAVLYALKTGRLLRHYVLMNLPLPATSRTLRITKNSIRKMVVRKVI